MKRAAIFFSGAATALFLQYLAAEFFFQARALSNGCEERVTRDIAKEQVRSCLDKAACIWYRF